MPPIRAAALSDLPTGAMLSVAPGGREIILCRHDGAIHALDAVCPHRNGPLAQGNFLDGRLICPWHAWEFHCETGCYDYDSSIRLQRFPVSVLDGDIYVTLDA